MSNISKVSVGSVTPPNAPLTFESTPINLLNTGVTPIFTANQDFCITNIICYGIDLTGTIGGATASFGWNSPDYNDITSGFNAFVTAQNNVNASPLGSIITDIPRLPAGGTLNINVTNEDESATTDTQIIYIQGFYL